VTESTIDAGTRLAAERFARVRGAVAAVLGLVCISVVLHVVWLVRFRQGYVVEWDESGYMQFALSNFDALHDHGPWTFAKTVGGRGGYGPLLPLVTSLSYPVLGRGVFGSLLVLPLFFAGLVGATFGLARRLVPDRWAVLAAVVVAGMPAVIDYARLYHFALPATACMTAALWALLRSEGLSRPGWSAAFGLFVALTLLSRTMTVAYIPAFLLATGAQFLAGDTALRVRLRNVAIVAGATVLVAGPWYIRNFHSVWGGLAGSGYGEDSVQYGRHYPIASWGFWTKELRLDLFHLGLPLAVALLLCFGSALAFLAVRRPRLSAGLYRSVRAAGVLALALVVLEGYFVLTSSRNEGTAFALPWLPALVVLAIVAAASVPARAVRAGLACALAFVSVAVVLSKSGSIETLADRHSASVPGFGSVPVIDGSGIIQREILGAGYDIEPLTQPLPDLHRRWLPLAHDVVGWSLRHAEARGEPLHLMLGTDDLIFSNWRLSLAAQLWFHRWQPVDYLTTFPNGDNVGWYRRQLLSPPHNALVIFDPRPYAKITPRKVAAAARPLGFRPLKSFTMPDGRKLQIWWRTQVSTV
jgi:hypothetical protein